MKQLINKKAPGLTGQLSPDAACAVHDILAQRSLSTAATPNEAAIRRDARPEDAPTLLRPAFMRDCEKILHMPAYNRLNGKTQVFSFRADDDLARRGLHEQLVCRVARDIGRALGLNLDLIEAIALGHDIGHTPFGHAGERYLNTVFHERTGKWFFHNLQSVRALDVLYGRNLSLQTLDGVVSHNGEFEQQRFKTSSLASFEEFDQTLERCWSEGKDAIKHLRPMTLEGCVVRISDIIAYVGKDRQDAIRAHLVDADVFDDGLGGSYNAWALMVFVADVVEMSIGTGEIRMSEEGFSELARAKRENYEKIYGSREVEADFAPQVAELFRMLYDHELTALETGDESQAIFTQHIIPLTNHLSHYGKHLDWESDHDRCVVDFISAMTDDYFIATCEKLFPTARELFPKRSYFDGIRP